MNFIDFFRNVFGIRRNYSEDNPFYRDEYTGDLNGERRSSWSHDDGGGDDDDTGLEYFDEQPFQFKITPGPIDIHCFLEEQLNDMLKSFQIVVPDLKLALEEFGSVDPSHKFQKESITEGMTPRDEVLKPQYRYKHGFKNNLQHKREDTDLDESIKASSLAVILDKDSSQDTSDRDRHSSTLSSFGKSVMSKTIRRPDGSVEHHHTVRDTLGNEKTTITRQVGDKKYTVVTESDASGILKNSESFENVDETSIEDFKRKLSSPDSSMKFGGIDFSKFFKLS